MKIVILDAYVANPGDLSWAALEQLGDLTIYDKTAAEDTIARIGDAEIVILNKTAIDASILEACPSIKYIGVLATGYNVVDTAAAAAKGIPVCNVPAYSTDAVTQHVFALILEICLNVGAHNQAVKDGEWTRSPYFSFWNSPLIELAGQTLGIVGYGAIGRSVAKVAQAFGMKVVANRRNPRPEDAADGVEMLSLDELYAVSDIVTLHAPLTVETTHMINRDSIAKMKDGVILINTARGPLIHDEDLAAALDSAKVYAAGIDVATVEPIPADNPLLKRDNCLITPHIAWAPLAARSRLLDITAKNVEAFLAGKPQNQVN